MRPQPAKGEIRPKISTMPRQKTEAAAYLNIYKLTIEKKRLQQELNSLEERRQQLQNRLALITSQVHELEKSAQELRVSLPSAPVLPNQPQNLTVSASDSFSTFFLEY
jgi:chromosome segregation ATPase